MDNQQFVIVPKKDNGLLLEKYEILVYVCIRRYMNKDTMKAFPSLDTIAKDSGCSKPTVMKTIDRIKEKGYLHTEPFQRGRGTVYIFNNEKSFEPFSYEFLDNKNLSKSEKFQILCTQQYMYKNDGIGKVSYSDRELCELTGLDRSTLRKNNRSLIKKGYMAEISLQKRNPETGLMNKETIYHLNELGQAIVFKLQDHESRIQENENSINDMMKKLESQGKDIQILMNQIKILQEENEKLKHGDMPTSFSFEV